MEGRLLSGKSRGRPAGRLLRMLVGRAESGAERGREPGMLEGRALRSPVGRAEMGREPGREVGRAGISGTAAAGREGRVSRAERTLARPGTAEFSGRAAREEIIETWVRGTAVLKITSRAVPVGRLERPGRLMVGRAGRAVAGGC